MGTTREYREANKEYIKAYKKAFYEAHKEELRAKAKLYRDSHKQELNARNKAYREAYPEKKKASDAAYHAKNKEKAKAQAKVYYEKNKGVIHAKEQAKKENPSTRISIFAYHAIRRSKEKGREYDKEFLESLSDFPPTHCKCCGEALDYTTGRGNDKARSPSLDRVDNSKGYIRGNIEIICYECNDHKGTASIKKLETIMAYMKKHGLT